MFNFLALLDIRVFGRLHISYTMCARDLPDICTLGPRACGPWALSVYIRQTTRAHGITIKYTYSICFA